MDRLSQVHKEITGTLRENAFKEFLKKCIFDLQKIVNYSPHFLGDDELFRDFGKFWA